MKVSVSRRAFAAFFVGSPREVEEEEEHLPSLCAINSG